MLREDLQVGQEVHFGAALFGVAGDLHRADLEAVALLNHPVLRDALLELHVVRLAIAAHRQAQPLAQAVDAAHAHAVQTARDLVAVLVELAAGMQLGQRDLGRTALGLVLVVHLHPRGDAAAVVGDADAVVAVDGDDDVVAMPGQAFVDGVVDHLEHQVVQPGAVAGVADVHARALAHRLQAFQDLDAAFAIGFAVRSRVIALGLAHLFVGGVQGIAHGAFRLDRWGRWGRFQRPLETLKRAAARLALAMPSPRCASA